MLVFHTDNLAKGNAMTTVATALPLEQPETVPQKLFSGLTSAFQTVAKSVGNFARDFVIANPLLTAATVYTAVDIHMGGVMTTGLLTNAASAFSDIIAAGASHVADAAIDTASNAVPDFIDDAVSAAGAVASVAEVAVTETANNIGMVAEAITQNPLDHVADSMAVLEDKGLVEATKDSFTGAIKSQAETFVKWTLPIMEHYLR